MTRELTSIVEDEIDSTSLTASESEVGRADEFPKGDEIVSENVLLRRGEIFSSGTLKRLDVVCRVVSQLEYSTKYGEAKRTLSHLSERNVSDAIAKEKWTYVDEKREIGSISPERDLRELVEDESSSSELQLGRELRIVDVGLGQSHGELEDGVSRSGEGLAFCVATYRQLRESKGDSTKRKFDKDRTQGSGWTARTEEEMRGNRSRGEGE